METTNNSISTGKIDLWLFEQPQQGKFTCSELLLENQQQKLPTLHSNKQTEYGYTRLLLNHIVRQNINSGSTLSEKATLNQTITVDDQKGLPPHIPALKEQGAIFTISHSASLIGIAIARIGTNSSAKLGLDIELISVKRRLSAARLFCNEGQLKTLNQQSSQSRKVEYFTRLWTQKEAYFKAQHKAVLNPDLKPLAISDVKTDNAANMQSTLWSTQQAKHYQISICNNFDAEINVHLTDINSQGEISKTLKGDVDWQLLFAAINDYGTSD